LPDRKFPDALPIRLLRVAEPPNRTKKVGATEKARKQLNVFLALDLVYSERTITLAFRFWRLAPA
jgi:hypothetical protein